VTIHHTDESVTLYHGDCREVLLSLPDASVDAVVTDPPYELGFMGKGWDASGIAYEVALWRDVLRVLKPGGHLLAFGGTRTWHRLACAIEDAGFEVRDSIAWMYGSGFPKSLDVSKAIDKAAGAEREVIGTRQQAPKFNTAASGSKNTGYNRRLDEEGAVAEFNITAPATPAAQQWQGWGTALKPAFEPIVVARKPLIGTVAANVLAHGTGALNVDGCRIGTSDNLNGGAYSEGYSAKVPDGDERTGAALGMYQPGAKPEGDYKQPAGRWPANVILDESQAQALDRMSGVLSAGGRPASAGIRSAPGAANGTLGDGWAGIERETRENLDSGGASRFFYTAKADSSERPRVDGVAHPTVKPLDLMRYLVRLVTPPGGVVLEPFAGSGTTLEACIVEGFRCIGIEREDTYLPLIMARISKPIEPVMF
jgi:DNA modification methylase